MVYLDLANKDILIGPGLSRSRQAQQAFPEAELGLGSYVTTVRFWSVPWECHHEEISPGHSDGCTP